MQRDLLDKDKRFAAVMDQWRQTEANYDFAKAETDSQTSLKNWQPKRDDAMAADRPPPPKPEEPRNLRGGRAGHPRPGNLHGGLIHPVAGFARQASPLSARTPLLGRSFGPSAISIDPERVVLKNALGVIRL